MPDPKLTILGDSRKAQEAVTRLEKRLEKLEQKNRQLNRQVRRHGRQGTRSLQDMARSAGKLALELGGIVGPIGLGIAAVRRLQAELNRVRERQRQAAQENIGLAQLQVEAFAAVGADPDIKRPKQLVQEIKQVVRETGVPETEVTQQAIPALSSRGERTVKDALSVLQTALEFRPLKPEQAGQFASGALTLQQQFPEVTAREAMGFLARGATLSKVTDVGKFAENLAPAIQAGAIFGDSKRESAALFANLTQSINDASGEEVRTLMAQLQLSLFERLNKTTGFPELTSTRERIEFLQENPEFARRFVQGGEFGGETFGKAALGKGKAKGAVFGLVGAPVQDEEAGEAIRERQREFLRRQVPIEQGDELFRREMQQRRELPAFGLAREQQRQQATAEQLRLSNVEGAQAAISRKGLREELEGIAGLSQARIDTLMAEFEARSNFGRNQPNRVAIELLKEQQRALEAPTHGVAQTLLDQITMPFLAPFRAATETMEFTGALRAEDVERMQPRITRPANELERIQARDLQRLIDALEEDRRKGRREPPLQRTRRGGTNTDALIEVLFGIDRPGNLRDPRLPEEMSPDAPRAPVGDVPLRPPADASPQGADVSGRPLPGLGTPVQLAPLIPEVRVRGGDGAATPAQRPERPRDNGTRLQGTVEPRDMQAVRQALQENTRALSENTRQRASAPARNSGSRGPRVNRNANRE